MGMLYHHAFMDALSPGTMDPSQYAKTVVAEAISTRPRATLWAGKHTLLVFAYVLRSSGFGFL